MRMFNRTTRSVALTEAGERLLSEVQPILESLDHALESVNAFRDKPIGTLRLAVERSASQVMLARARVPLIQPFLAQYPGVRVEVVIEDTPGDIISGRFDAGVRLGNRIERDMTILRMGDDSRVIAVAAPSYMAGRPAPSVPEDLHGLDCVRLRSPWDGSIHPWPFTKGDRHVEVVVDGPLVVNDVDILLDHVLDGVGVGCLPEPMVASHLAAGRLVSLLDGWSRELPGVFLYHPSRRQPPMPLQVFLRFVEAWRKQSRHAGALEAIAS